jgi:hypothetical protein
VKFHRRKSNGRSLPCAAALGGGRSAQPAIAARVRLRRPARRGCERAQVRLVALALYSPEFNTGQVMHFGFSSIRESPIAIHIPAMFQRRQAHGLQLYFALVRKRAFEG